MAVSLKYVCECNMKLTGGSRRRHVIVLSAGACAPRASRWGSSPRPRARAHAAPLAPSARLLRPTARPPTAVAPSLAAAAGAAAISL